MFTPLLLLAVGLADEPDPPEAFLRPGDRVALVGGSFWEGERRSGAIETALTLAVPDVTFRHLGWAGDMADQSARRFFGTAEDGRKHLLEHLDLVKPTAILVAYGQAEALPGGMSVERFEAEMNSLLDELEQRTGRIALVAPTGKWHTEAKTLDGIVDWEFLRYRDVVRRLSRERKHRHIEPGIWFDGETRKTLGEAIAVEVIRLHPYGDFMTGLPRPKTYRYEPLATLFAEVLGFSTVDLSEPAETGGDEIFDRLPVLLRSVFKSARWSVRQNRVTDAYRLRDLIRAKNTLFLHRHRPHNETYLRGFRKHEQGGNAEEIYAFEQLVAAKDAEIQQLRDEIVGDEK